MILPPPQSDHLPGDVPGEEKEGAEVDFHHRVKILGGVVLGGGEADDPGIIDQNVHPPEGVDAFFRQRRGEFAVSQVVGDGKGSAAQLLDLGLGGAHAVIAYAHDVGSRLSQGDGHGTPQTPADAGDHGNFSVQ